MTDSMEPTSPGIGETKTWIAKGGLIMSAQIHCVEFVQRTCEVETFGAGHSSWSKMTWEEWRDMSEEADDGR